jgi:uncharacterized protein YgbK (DUF1537 family)
MLRCLLIADDLTGAADACVKFVACGFSGMVLLSTDSQPADWHTVDTDVGGDIVAINTDTRRLAEGEARRRVRATGRFSRALAHGGEPGAVFKKIDSTLRGHLGVEINEAMDTFGRTHAIVCPAFPAMRRTVRDGLLIVTDAAGAAERLAERRDAQVRTDRNGGERVVCDVAARLAEQGIAGTDIARINYRELDTVAIAKTAMEATLARGARALVCDATSLRDLETIVSAASEAGGRPLWTGSAGLADALATRFAEALATRLAAEGITSPPQLLPQSIPRRATSAASVLMFVGSVHAVTREQETRVLRARDVVLVDIDRDAQPRPAAELRAALDAGRHVLVPINVKDPEHVEQIKRHVVQVLRDASVVTRIAGFVMTGGDTAADVCGVLGVRALQLHGEVEQGVPWGTMRGGAADGLTMVLKAGAFGTPDTLIACLDFLVSRMNVHQSDV